VRLLIKLGGSLLETVESRRRLAREIGAARKPVDGKPGAEIVVVHGGGKQLTRFLSERGIESRFVNGLRVTGATVLDSVVKVVAGSVNREFVAACVAENVPGVGISGVDALLTEVAPLSPDLGFVGRPVRSDARLLEALVSQDFLPVVACVAADRQGSLYNVNADQMAASCAEAFRADKLLFLTDVDGVRGADDRILPLLTVEECRNLIEKGIATGGMQAKLESAISALTGGVPEVLIVPGAEFGAENCNMPYIKMGTSIVK
jgi:acetylglutamate kinase